MPLQSAIRELLLDAFGHLLPGNAEVRSIKAEQIPIEYPDEARGDLASPVAFQLGKMMKKAPAEIAKELAYHINTHAEHHRVTINGKHVPALEVVREAVAEGPFVNFWLSDALLQKTVADVLTPAPAPAPTGDPIVVEYSGVNIGKPFSIGHLRSTVVGDALANLLEATGHKVVRMNYLGDWGTQFGKLIVGWQKWGDSKALADAPVRELVRVYVKFHEESAKDATLVEEARAWFRKLETHDAEATKLWQQFREASLKNANEIYDLLEVKFDEVSGEAQYADKLDEVLALLKSKSLLTESQGALVVDLEKEGMPPLLLQKSDEGSLYATREIAAAMDRFERYHFDRMLYEVGIEQELHFRQVFAVLRKAGLPWADRLEHVPHNLYAVNGKKMSTRAGRVADMKEILEEAIARADKVIASKNPELKGRASVARQVGIGAVKYHDLSQSRLTRIEFDYDRMLSLEGNSAPYLQYTVARAHSILAKAELDPVKVAALKIKKAVRKDVVATEKALARRLTRFDAAIAAAAERRLPHLLATELYELATRFNAFYAAAPVLKAEEPARTHRLRLSTATAAAIERGLALLGIHAPHEM